MPRVYVGSTSIAHGAVRIQEHELLMEYALECTYERDRTLAQYAEQILAPLPPESDGQPGTYVPVEATADNNGTGPSLVLTHEGVRVYEWPL